jgi:hypothetical protein
MQSLAAIERVMRYFTILLLAIHARGLRLSTIHS